MSSPSRRHFTVPLAHGLVLDLGPRTLVMGILNVTPDSFSDGGHHPTHDAALAARKLGIAYTPSIVLFDAGKEAFRIEAYVRPFHLAGALDYVASGAYRSEPSFQRFLQARGERMRGRGEAGSWAAVRVTGAGAYDLEGKII